MIKEIAGYVALGIILLLFVGAFFIFLPPDDGKPPPDEERLHPPLKGLINLSGPFTVKFVRIEENTHWTPAALQSLVGQEPRFIGMDGSSRARVVAAWIEDGWVTVTLEPLHDEHGSPDRQ